MNKLLTCAAAMLATTVAADACTNFLVTRGASADGSTFVTYAADSHVLYGELYYRPAADYAPGTMLDVYEWDTHKYLGRIEQAAHTYAVVGNMNEHQLTIAETTYGGRHELADSTATMDYGSLIYITLQRATTAREAIGVMADLVSRYGYYSEGESFSIADPNEVWVMEMIGKGAGNRGAVWVAVRIPDGCVSGHANQARITTFPLNDPDNCLYSPDVISFARERGYFSGKDRDFSFADAYAPLDFGAVRFCDARVWSGFKTMNAEMRRYEKYARGESRERMPLYIKPDHKVTRAELAAIMRDHYEGTSMDMTVDVGAGPYHVPYRWRPMEFKVDGVEYLHERAIATQQTGFWFVAQMRAWLPAPVGGILWFGCDDAATSVLVPMYCGIRQAPAQFAVGNGDMLTFSANSAFWVFNRVANMAYARYEPMMSDIKPLQQRLESMAQACIPGIDAAASELMKTNEAEARQLLTEFSASQAATVVDRWTQLSEFLLVKYLDGNIHPETDGVFHRNPHGGPASPKFPGYDEKYYRNIVNDAGANLKVGVLPEK